MLEGLVFYIGVKMEINYAGGVEWVQGCMGGYLDRLDWDCR
jgi:hypothetical protein